MTETREDANMMLLLAVVSASGDLLVPLFGRLRYASTGIWWRLASPISFALADDTLKGDLGRREAGLSE